MSTTTTRTVITKEALLGAMREAVTEAGEDYVYETQGTLGLPACVYVRDGAPSCIVGHALYRLGVPLDVLKKIDGGGDPMADFDGSGIDGRWAQHVLAEAGFEFEPDAHVAATVAQEHQDHGKKWGVALAEAERVR